MDPLLVVWGSMVAIGAIYWWEQKIVAFAGSDSLANSFPCLVTAGMNKACVMSDMAGLQQENWLATALFYLGVGLVLYTFLFPPPPPPEPLR